MSWTATWISSRMLWLLAAAGVLLAVSTLPDSARARESASGAAKVSARVRDFVRARAVPGTTAIELPQLGSFDVGGPVEVSLSTREKAPFYGRVPVTVEMRRAGKLVKRGVITARVRAKRRVLVATRALRRGSVVERADLALEDRDLSATRGGASKRIADFVGLRVKRSLAAGSVLRRDVVEAVPIINRGEPVRLRYDYGGLHIDSSGVAREEGGAGEMIAVEVRGSRRQLSGRIDANGAVHVGF